MLVVEAFKRVCLKIRYSTWKSNGLWRFSHLNGVFLGYIPFYDTAISPMLPCRLLLVPGAAGNGTRLAHAKRSGATGAPCHEMRGDCWLVVWNMNFIFPYIGKNNPNWLILFQRGWNHQPGVCLKMGYSHEKPWKFGGNRWERTKNWCYFLVIMTSTIYDLVPWLAQFGESRRGFRWFPSHVYQVTSSTAQGSGGSFKNRKPIGEVGCCESRMAERSTDGSKGGWGLLSFSLSYSDYLPTYLPIHPSILSILSIFLSI